jgi:AraC family transcriptional regulator
LRGQPVADEVVPSGVDERAAGERGLAICQAAALDALPQTIRQTVEHTHRAPDRTVGVDENSSLKISFWRPHIKNIDIEGDLNYLSVVLHISGHRIWRAGHPTPSEPGSVNTHPFEVARWRFEGASSYLPVHIPFALLSGVSECLFGRELRQDQIWVPLGTRDPRLCQVMRSVHHGCVSALTPTNLILDSWALILSEILLRQFSSYAGKYSRVSLGKLPARGVALVIDYVEANLDRDLRLNALAKVSAMSTYHFARRFKATVGISPHVYVVVRRVRRAQHMVRHTRSPLAEIAARCGFSSQAHFTTAFQRILGVSPGEYRRAL